MNFIDTFKKYVSLVPSGGAVRIGRANKFLRPAEWITEKELGHHIHIVGASGFGKTVLISHILRSRIEAGGLVRRSVEIRRSSGMFFM